MTLAQASRPHSPVEQRPARGPLAKIADLAYRRRWRVIAVWLVALVAATAASAAFAGDFKADYTAPGSDSRAAQDLLTQRFPSRAGDTIDVVVSGDRAVASPQARAAVGDLLAAIRGVPHVVGTDDPYATPGAVAPDGRTLLARARLDVVNPVDMPVADTKQIMAIAERASRDGLQVDLDGQAVSQAQQGDIGSEGIGLAAAALILLVTFGSVVAAGLPIVVAVVGLGVSSAMVGLAALVVDVPDWSTSLAAMMGIGVGIDYVLLLVTRYREFLAEGLDPQNATVATVDTAGRSVIVAGTTVVISLVGLSATGLSAMRGAALVTIVAVLLVMLAAVTLVPALLGLVRHRIDRLRLPGRHVGRGAGSPAWARWSLLVQRRAWPAALAGTALLGLLAVPFLGVRFGFPDAGNDVGGTTTRQAYDRIAQAYGPGANGPLLLAAELPAPGDTRALHALGSRLRSVPGVAAVQPLQVNPGRDTAILTVIPTSGPQDEATQDLVRRIRADVVPAATAGTGTRVFVGGATAGAIDTTDNIASKLPLLIGGVVGLSMLLLLVAFRSVVVPVKAAVVNLLSIGAAYGVVALVLQGGWAGRLVGIDTATPLPAFIPVLMFAILFGLSMDYEVFLLSRIREQWLATGDNARSVSAGLSLTARVITAAAAIMVAVFGAFVPSDLVFLKVIGIGLATAILVDATVVRMLLVPAAMQLLGRANWWLPRLLERGIPTVRVEGHPEGYLAGVRGRATVPAPAPAAD